MIQCFAQKKFHSSFKLAEEPQLAYVSQIPAEDSVHPRVMHAHDDLLELVLICQGEGEYSIDGIERHVRAGDLLIYNSGVVHDERSGPNVKISSYCVAISNLRIVGLRANAIIDDRSCPVFPTGERFEMLRDTMALMFRMLSAGREESCHYMQLALLACVWGVIHSPATTQPRENVNLLGKRIKEYIDAHYSEEISLQSISDDLNISQYYLAHVFKDMTGYSPIQYITRRRVGEAQSLLLTTDYTVTQIAAMVGYSNPSHFNQHFTRYVGMTPRNYRKNYIVPKENDQK